MIVVVFGESKTNLVQFSLQTWTNLRTKFKMFPRGAEALSPIETRGRCGEAIQSGLWATSIK